MFLEKFNKVLPLIGVHQRVTTWLYRSEDLQTVGTSGMRVMNGRNDERMVDEGRGRGLIWGTMPGINWKGGKKKVRTTSDRTVGVPVQISTVSILQHKWETLFIAGVTEQKVSQMSSHVLTTELISSYLKRWNLILETWMITQVDKQSRYLNGTRTFITYLLTSVKDLREYGIKIMLSRTQPLRSKFLSVHLIAHSKFNGQYKITGL